MLRYASYVLINMLLKYKELQEDIMSKKTHTIQIRLNEQEYQALSQKCLQSKMKLSSYVRACLSGNTVSEMGNRREITVKLLEMYSIVNQYSDEEKRAELLDRMDDICRFLKS